ncbi:filament-like plant protein 7-like [Dorcoceras hygrometricum]|uniref:Filament-like plant protein 7-like n=1 Tax=Dorcoceras hygrometricum TaxID=472368 RepID=A0A2Z7CLV2_9LAMI|nr:filament-like plant protein 7-like [Dorcoceras hygrometricum]
MLCMNSRAQQKATTNGREPESRRQLKADQESIATNNRCQWPRGVSQQGDEVRELPAQPQQHPDAMFNTESYTIRKAYTAASIITHAQSKVVKQAHIRTSSLLCYNYYNRVPSNTDLTPAKPNTDTNSGTVTQKPRIGSYKLNPSLSYPSNTIESSKQTQEDLNTYPNKLGRNANRLHKGDVLEHLTSFKKASKRSTQTKRLSKRSPALQLLLQSELSTVGNRKK